MTTKLAIAFALTFVAAAAAAQQSGLSQRRAPLANVDDLEPAVGNASTGTTGGSSAGSDFGARTYGGSESASQIRL
ncbi:MAG TPA: hypothetical protein VM692_07360, partial [Gammaproteobacteria bacterium]|nr:hypothetical protein [Gammaproteobacteria bacterium]